MKQRTLNIANLCPVSLHIPCSVWRQCPVRTSHTRTVESALPDTRMLLRSSIPLVSDWCPVSVWTQAPRATKQPPSASLSRLRPGTKSRKRRRAPVSASHTLMDVSNEPLTTNTPSNCHETKHRRESALKPSEHTWHACLAVSALSSLTCYICV